MTAAEYLSLVERELCGGRAARRRLLAELRDHVADAVAARDEDAVARLGEPAELLAAWRSHVAAARARTRRRAALLALTVATAGALGIAEHASGHRPPRDPCAPGAAQAPPPAACHAGR